MRGCEAELLASTINTLGPFMEDELNSDAQPIRITVHNTRITLKVRGSGAVGNLSEHFSLCQKNNILSGIIVLLLISGEEKYV